VRSAPVTSGFWRPITRKRVVLFGSSSTLLASTLRPYSSPAAALAIAAPSPVSETRFAAAPLLATASRGTPGRLESSQRRHCASDCGCE
jgi:hypothetical protein